MFKWILVVIIFPLTGCVHNQLASTTDSKRDPAQVQSQNMSFLCSRNDSGQARESFQVFSSGEVKYDLMTKDLPMEGRGPISANWISKNVVVLSGRWISDMVCGPPSSCEFSYFTIYLHKTGSGLEVKTYYRHPEGTWRSENSSISCKVTQ